MALVGLPALLRQEHPRDASEGLRSSPCQTPCPTRLLPLIASCRASLAGCDDPDTACRITDLKVRPESRTKSALQRHRIFSMIGVDGGGDTPSLCEADSVRDSGRTMRLLGSRRICKQAFMNTEHKGGRALTGGPPEVGAGSLSFCRFCGMFGRFRWAPGELSHSPGPTSPGPTLLPEIGTGSLSFCWFCLVFGPFRFSLRPRGTFPPSRPHFGFHVIALRQVCKGLTAGFTPAFWFRGSLRRRPSMR